MPIFTQQDIESVANDPIAHNLDDIRIKCDTTITKLKQQYGWIDNDIRIGVFHTFRNVTQDVLAIFAFHRSIFPSKNFWDAYFVSTPSRDDFANHYRELDTMNRFSTLHAYFSIYESNIRALVNAIDPLACNNGTAAFKSVLGWLHTRINLSQRYNDFLDLLRETRNTIHHNGIYRPEKGGSKTLNYNGISYQFNVGQPIDFIGWDFVTMLQNDFIELFLEIVEDPLVVSITHSPVLTKNFFYFK